MRLRGPRNGLCHDTCWLRDWLLSKPAGSAAAGFKAARLTVEQAFSAACKKRSAERRGTDPTTTWRLASEQTEDERQTEEMKDVKAFFCFFFFFRQRVAEATGHSWLSDRVRSGISGFEIRKAVRQ